MCTEAVCMDQYNLEFVPDHLKRQEMGNKVVRRDYTPRGIFLIILRHRDVQPGC